MNNPVPTPCPENLPAQFLDAADALERPGVVYAAIAEVTACVGLALRDVVENAQRELQVARGVEAVDVLAGRKLMLPARYEQWIPRQAPQVPYPLPIEAYSRRLAATFRLCARQLSDIYGMSHDTLDDVCGTVAAICAGARYGVERDQQLGRIKAPVAGVDYATTTGAIIPSRHVTSAWTHARLAAIGRGLTSTLNKELHI